MPALVGEAATRLCGLLPAPASLLALARSDADVAHLRRDPALVLLLCRHAPPVLPSHPLLPTLLRNADVLDEAARQLDTAAPLAWNHPTVQRLVAAGLGYAERAAALAGTSGRVDPDAAWCAGLLAPLGWLAVVAVDVAAVDYCWNDPAFAEYPAETQARRWGLDQAAIARRLARHWRLPLWLAATIGHLGLHVDTAEKLGADPALFRVVQAAVGSVQREGEGLSLAVAASWVDHGLSCEVSPSASPVAQANEPPDDEALLREYLLLAAQNRRLSDAPAVDRLERTVDQLQRALESQRTDESARLLTMNLETMAEFAAGAGHEINNPLAVISGQAQYLLTHEAEPSRQRSLQTIIGQTQRIYDILTELMQFARPGRPQKRPLDLAHLIREVSVALVGLAEQRHVRLVCPEPEVGLSVLADPRQTQVALTCLLRNAIEAAPAEGWAGIRVEASTPDHLELIVEDSGPGPAPAQRPHLFDPFYSGRPAGRGRGLGLPTAWRLARENGGGVVFDDRATGPTRFVLTLPRAAHLNMPSAPLNGHAEEVPAA